MESKHAVCRLNSDQPIGVEDTPQFKFARDLLRYVLEKRMEGLYWRPTGIFERRNLGDDFDSPFTPQMKAAVNEKLDLYEYHYHMIYDNFFQGKQITEDSFFKIRYKLFKRLFGYDFNEKLFFTYCVILAKFVGLTYLHGVSSVAEDAVKHIIMLVGHLKEQRVMNEDFWLVLQGFVEKFNLKDDKSLNLNFGKK